MNRKWQRESLKTGTCLACNSELPYGFTATILKVAAKDCFKDKKKSSPAVLSEQVKGKPGLWLINTDEHPILGTDFAITR